MTPESRPYRVLFVCLGNICRSPAAENILRAKASDAGRAAEFEIDSAGTIGHHEGSPPDERMTEALLRKHIPSEGRARKIRRQDLEHFDLIVTMDETNLEDVRALEPSGIYHHKVHPFVSFCLHHKAPRIPDPYYGGQRGFDHVIDLLEDGCEGILERLSSKK